MNISTPTLFAFWICLLSSIHLYAQPQGEGRPKINAEAFYQRALEFHHAGQYDIAVNYYSEALHIDDSHHSSRYNRGLAYYELEKYNKALFDFNRLIEFNSNDFALYEQRARVRYLLNDPVGAVNDYNEAMKHAPTSILLVNRGLAESRLENYTQAMADFDRALVENPLDTEALVGKGDTYFAMGDFHNAIQYYTEALHIYPDDERTYNNRANAYAKLDKKEEALQDYNKAIEIQPNSYVYVNRGFFWMDNENTTKALTDFLEASRLNFNNANAFYGICLAKMEKGLLEEASENADKAIQLENDNELYLNASANISFQKTAYEDAIYTWQRVLKLDPENEEAINGIQAAKAALQDATSDHEEPYQESSFAAPSYEYFTDAATEAEELTEDDYVPIPTYDISLTEELPFPEHYDEHLAVQEVFIPKGIPAKKAPPAKLPVRKALFELNPGSLTVSPEPRPDQAQMLQQAKALLAAARFHEAVSEFTRLIDLNKQNTEALTGRGTANYKLLNYQQALADFNEVLSQNPDLAEVYFLRGNVFFDLQNTYKAIADFSKALEISPDFAEAYYMRGVCYSNLREFEPALKDFSNCLEIAPDKLEALNNQATIKFISGNIFESIEDYNQAIKRFPFESILYANRAKAKEQLSWYKSALEDCEMALLLLPVKEDYYFLRGVLHYKLKDYANAIEDLTYCINHSTSPQAEYFYRRALSYHFNGNLTLALKDYTKAIFLNPNNVEALFNRGLVHVEQGHQTLACQDFTKAESLGLENAKKQLSKLNCATK